jgi:type II secretory pathway pseudopilin PulG
MCTHFRNRPFRFVGAPSFVVSRPSSDNSLAENKLRAPSDLGPTLADIRGVTQTRTHRHSSGEAGYSLVELAIVVGLVTLIMSGAVGMSKTAIAWARSQAAATAVKAQLIEARDVALSTRRSVEVRFVGTSQIQLLRFNPDGTQTVIGGTSLESRNEWRTFGGVPDTPDAFGNTQPLDFDNVAPPYVFTSDGTFVDAAGVPLSGSIFMGVINQPATARAVTVFGGTGRVVAYTWDGTQWKH